mmetsp:Transcript_28796/g.67621  ORF Transcript_28796/g.67621 Transcript_28796/m.67621 type:complete len:95 (+) Transcript_28796:193-477(+)
MMLNFFYGRGTSTCRLPLNDVAILAQEFDFEKNVLTSCKGFHCWWLAKGFSFLLLLSYLLVVAAALTKTPIIQNDKNLLLIVETTAGDNHLNQI